jgi:hypothetical protein
MINLRYHFRKIEDAHMQIQAPKTLAAGCRI